MLKRNFSQGGFSLIEVIVALGIMGIGLGVASTAIITSMNAMSRVERKKEALIVTRQIENLIGFGSNCKVSFDGLKLKTSDEASRTEVKELFYAEQGSDGAWKKRNSASYASYSPKKKGVPDLSQVGFMKLSGFEIERGIKIGSSPERFVASFHYGMTHHGSGDEMGTTPLPLMLTLDSAGKITDCYGVNGFQFSDFTPPSPGTNTTTVTSNFIDVCRTISDGFQKFDPATGKCVDAYDWSWKYGNNSGASCPSGWKRVPIGQKHGCRTVASAGYSTGGTGPASGTRDFDDGAFTQVVNHVRKSVQGDACRCEYANDAGDTSGHICGIRCYQP